MRKTFNKSLPAGRQGFTLIELLVVIAIIGILASIVLVSLNSARSKGRDAQRESELKEMAKSIELADNGTAQPIVGCLTSTTHHVDASACNGPAPINFTNYKDPSTPTGTFCAAGTGGATCQFSISQASGLAGTATTENYRICSVLENGNTGFGGAQATLGSVHVGSDTTTGVTFSC